MEIPESLRSPSKPPPERIHFWMLSPFPCYPAEPEAVVVAQAITALYQMHEDDPLFDDVYEYWQDAITHVRWSRHSRVETADEYEFGENATPLPKPGQRASYRELKEQADIVDYISQFTTLTHSGGKYKGRCPFHEEKTPSFWVYPLSRSYYCFGCQAHGDVIDFAKAKDRDPYEVVHAQ